MITSNISDLPIHGATFRSVKTKTTWWHHSHRSKAHCSTQEMCRQYLSSKNHTRHLSRRHSAGERLTIGAKNLHHRILKSISNASGRLKMNSIIIPEKVFELIRPYFIRVCYSTLLPASIRMTCHWLYYKNICTTTFITNILPFLAIPDTFNLMKFPHFSLPRWPEPLFIGLFFHLKYFQNKTKI